MLQRYKRRLVATQMITILFSIKMEHTVQLCQTFDSKIRRDHRKENRF